MMVALREGYTLRKFGITRNCPLFKAYCEARPEYAREVLPLAAANQKAADLRKGDRFRTLIHAGFSALWIYVTATYGIALATVWT